MPCIILRVYALNFVWTFLPTVFRAHFKDLFSYHRSRKHCTKKKKKNILWGMYSPKMRKNHVCVKEKRSTPSRNNIFWIVYFHSACDNNNQIYLTRV